MRLTINEVTTKPLLRSWMLCLIGFPVKEKN